MTGRPVLTAAVPVAGFVSNQVGNTYEDSGFVKYTIAQIWGCHSEGAIISLQARMPVT